MRRLAAIALAALLAAPLAAPGAEADRLARVAEAIRREAALPNGAPIGRPLPLAGHWNTGHYSRAKGMDPAFQMTLIEAGHHLLPWFQLNAPWWNPIGAEYYEAPMKRAAELKLPVTFVATQFEAGLTNMKEFFDLPAEKNPNVVGPDGKVAKMVSPFGPVEPWRQIGRKWTRLAILRECQQWHPGPARVIFLSNNEHARLRWHQAERSKRYLAAHGRGRGGEHKRRVFGAGWIERYRALQAGMREGLTVPAWKRGATFVGYDAFGPPHLGRWGGWMQYSLYTPGRVCPWPLAWDGGSPSYYVHNWNPSTDHTVWSPQVESQQWPSMLRQAVKLNPDFWWEISVWDGHQPTRDDDMRKVYARKGQTFTPRRYRGFVQFGMWLLRPRVVREFRGWTDSREKIMPFFRQVLDSVDRVHRDPALAAFWRTGRLVPNPAGGHPYRHAVPADCAAAERWFLLDTDLTPPRPWKLGTQIPVFAVALARGAAPRRQWLLYAHSPVSDRKDVKITLPGHGPVTADVAVGGSFLRVDEQAKSVTPLPPAGARRP